MAAWDELVPVYRQAVRAYFEREGTDPDSPAAEATIKTNAELVPTRVDLLVRMLAANTPARDLSGKAVLDVGCGFGACSLYLGATERPATVVGVDLSEVFLRVGREVLAERHMPGVVLEQGDMVAIPEADARFDVVVVNNSYVYFPERRKLAMSMREFHRVLKPGGVIVFFQANRWYPREAFTKLPLVQFLPRTLADRVVRRSGRRSTYLDVRLLSPVHHRRLLRRAGFTEVRIAHPSRPDDASGWKRFLASYYLVAGMKPDWCPRAE